MKKRVFFTLMVIFIWANITIAFNDGHSTVTGIVKEISRGSIVIGDTKYILSPKCKVKIEYNVDNAIYMKPAKLFDLKQGDSVNVVKIANTITEINIERWKK